MLDNLTIRNKLVLLVAGPILIVVVLAMFDGRERQHSASESQKVADLVAVAQANANVVDALQQEAISSSAHIGSGHKAWKQELAKARKATDAAMQVAVARLQGGGGTAGYDSAKNLAVGAAEKLPYIRKSVDQGYRWDQAVNTYVSTEDTFLAVNTAIADALTDPQAGSQLRTAAALASYKSALAREGAILSAIAERGDFGSKSGFSQLQGARRDEISRNEIFGTVAGSGPKGAVRDALAIDERLAMEEVSDRAAAAGASGKVSADPKATAAGASKVVSELHDVEAGLVSRLLSASQATSSSAERDANMFLVAALIAVIASAGAAVVLGRRITRPLNRLTQAADHLSKEQMPRLIQTLKNPSEDELGFQINAMRPIELESNDEIGRLAKSFNEVQRVASQVAEEQAQLLRKGIGEMFVNLARRNQALLDRQIEFIDELERGEEDPDQLDNLYRLDHLATRMRRNAESLLVLAGAEPPRRRGRPAPLANVVRAALAEVEDFGRIELLSLDEVLVASNAAADLAHLLSELMENATNFSPPETRVEVVGHKTKADGYVISVTDHGIGMSAEQIAEANESLAKPPLVGLAMTRSLGFIVVGRLATRHGIAVRMMASASGGVTAVVSLAPSLVVDTPGGGTIDTNMAAPARLKPVLEGGPSSESDSSGGGSAVPPIEFMPMESSEPAGSSSGALSWDAPPAAETPPPAPEPAAPAPAPAPTSSGLPSRNANSGSAISSANDASPLGQPIAWDAIEEAVSSPAPPELVEPPVSAAPSLSDALPAFDLADALPPVTDTSGVGPEPLPGAAAPAPPTPAPTPATVAPAAPATAAGANRPFFLEDAEPPRAFASSATEAAAPTARRTETPPPAPAPNAPGTAPSPPRLFGGQARPPAAPAAAPAPPRLPPSAQRPSSTPPPAPNGTANGSSNGTANGSANGAAPAPVAAAAPVAEPAPLPTRTNAGLAKRVPRQAGGQRAIPGSDTERGVGATKRSPEEIRQMLSRHNAGRQRARTEEPVPTGAPDERQSDD